MKQSFYFLFVFLFIGCDSSQNGDNELQLLNENNTTSLVHQQWSIQNDTSFYAQNFIDDNAHINPENTFDIYSGRGIKVAVIDNGFDVNHPEIKDRIIKTINVGQTDLNSDVSHTLSSDYHGTAVAGIIASAKDNIGIDGVSPDVELILIKMPEILSDSIIIELFQQAVESGADIINCSWGTGEVSDVVREYINDISSTARDAKGVIVVFACGNDNTAMAEDESSIKNVIGVGSTDKHNLRTFYSNYGKELDIVAPGGYELGITTLDPLGINGITKDEYNRYDEHNDGVPLSFIGTSASAPIISGVLALALEKNDGLTREEIANILKYSTDTIGNNTPYIDEMITSVSSSPVITGVFGKNANTNIKIRLLSKMNTKAYGWYSVSVNGDNSWSSKVTDTLSEGNYTIEVVSDDESIIWATDENFEINYLQENLSDIHKKRSDFYGYGKINLSKFISNIPAKI
ncbi:S8 family serine peptidase [bacterium]|nr:S8 family serine peptidase [bacterium]MBU1991234.1 S8 family serine peptidase [bacterium]